MDDQAELHYVARGKVRRIQWQGLVPGSMPDAAIAQRLCKTIEWVRLQRIARGIPAWRTPRRVIWTTRMLHLLGTASDQTLSTRWGMSINCVRHKRWSLGIPSFKHRQEPRPNRLPARVVKQLGQINDEALARLHGVPAVHVRARRIGLGIPPAVKVGPRRWTPAMIEDLARLGQTAFSRKYGTTSHTVHSKRVELGIASPWRFPEKVRWPRRMLARLGSITDRAMAQLMGISESAAREERIRRGIEPSHHPDVVDWTPERLAMLGKFSDGRLANEFGVNRKLIAAERVRRGIPAFRRSRGGERQEHRAGAIESPTQRG